MKALILFLTLALPFLTLLAQEPPQGIGFVKIANLITIETPTRIQIGDIKLNAGNPIPAGAASGNMSLFAGDYNFKVENPGTKPESVEGSFTLEADKTVIIVFYTDSKEFKNGDIETKLQFTKMTREEKMDSPKLSIISLSNKESVEVMLGNKLITLSPKRAHIHPVSLEQSLTLKHKEKELGSIDIVSPIHYLAFIYDSPESGELEMMLVEHTKIAYDPPKESFDEDEESPQQKSSENPKP